jgi:hypothetical protein
VKRPKHIKAQFKRKELHTVCGHVCVHVCAGLRVPCYNARPILACRRDRERGRGRETRWTTSQPPQGAGYAPIQSISLSRLPRSHLPHAQAAGVNKETDRQDSQTYRALTHSQPPQHVLQHTAPTVHTYAGRTIRTIAPHTYPCPGRSRCQKRKSRTSVLILEALCYRGIGIIKRDL